MNAIRLAESGLIPDFMIRQGIRRLIRERLATLHQQSPEDKAAFINALRKGPIAIATDKSNQQHYELPPRFYQDVLGKHLKYSCAYWPDSVTCLDEAEACALSMVCSRTAIENGMSLLELGCGWGSLTLWMASHYKDCAITAVSHSSLQRDYIQNQAALRGLNNVTVITKDMNDFDTDQTYDRIVSIEMFEHMRNYEALFRRISRWLKKEGRLFVHVFTHKEDAYFFETDEPNDWMAKYFFTGGTMPSRDLFSHFSEAMHIERQWEINGVHYQKTLEAWLAKMTALKGTVLKLFKECYGEREASTYYHRWRIFFMACSELFGYQNGEEWGVSHYLMKKR